jgi:hypothetical protein
LPDLCLAGRELPPIISGHEEAAFDFDTHRSFRCIPVQQSVALGDVQELHFFELPQEITCVSPDPLEAGHDLPLSSNMRFGLSDMPLGSDQILPFRASSSIRPA